MAYVAHKAVEGFKLSVRQQLEEAIEFAVNRRKNEPDCSEEELRQVAQETVQALLTQLVRATSEAYERSPMKGPDHGAITAVFDHLAVRADLENLIDSLKGPGHPNSYYVRLLTRKGEVEGHLVGIEDRDGVESVRLENPESYSALGGLQAVEVKGVS